MTTLSTPFAPAAAPRRPLTPTAAERLMLRASRAVEAHALARMRRRAARPATVIDTVTDERRTAQALGGIGILPR